SRSSDTCPERLRNLYHLFHLSDRMDADYMGAPEDSCGYGSSGAPVALRSGTLVERLPHERLARRPDEDRAIEGGGEVRQSSQHTIAVRRMFGKPDPRIDDDPAGCEPAADRHLEAAAELGDHLAHDVAILRTLVHGRRLPSHMHHDEGSSGFGDGLGDAA